MGRRILLLILAPFVAMALIAALVVGIFQAADIDLTNLITALFGRTPAATQAAAFLEFFRFPLRLVVAAALFLLAWVISRFSWRIAGWLLAAPGYRDIVGRSSDAADEPAAGPQSTDRRRQTLQHLVASLISLTVYLVAAILAVGQFVSIANLAIVATIVANAFGFAARDFIGDLLNGVSNIFEDRFDVGERVQIVRLGDTVEGVIEKVTVRTASLRTRTGELIVVPQGEIRILRNYSRGSFTGITVTVAVKAEDLAPAMALLLALAEEAPGILPDLIEPWRVISQEGSIRGTAELVIYAKAAYAHGADLRLHVMALVQERMSAAGIRLA